MGKVCSPKTSLAQNHRRPCPRTNLWERHGESGKKVTDTDSFGQHLYGHIDSFRYHFRPEEDTSETSVVNRNGQDYFPLLELSWKYKPPRHRTTGPPGHRASGQGLSFFRTRSLKDLGTACFSLTDRAHAFCPGSTERSITWARSAAQKASLAQYGRRLCPKPLQTLPVRSAELEKEIEVSTKTVPAAFIDTGGAASPGLGEGASQRNH